MLSRPRYADVTATLALVAALGGTAWAAVSLPADSVTSKQVKNRSLLAKDFKKGVIRRGAPGSTGPAGPTGPIGPVGPAGPAGESTPQTIANGSIGYAKLAASAVGLAKMGVQAVSTTSAFNTTSPKVLSASCPAGTSFIAGGGGVTDQSGVPLGGVAALSYNGPIPFLDGWRVEAFEPTAVGTSWQISAYALCLRD
ncbi:MAG: hypothetical protein ACJ762_09490 [Solirubrobacteraceae bacterium]